MTAKQQFLRRDLLATIHKHPFVIEAKSNEAWEEFLRNNYKVSSSAKLSISELQNLLDVLNRGAEVIVGGDRPRTKKEMITIKQEKYINKLWGTRSLLNLSDFCDRTIKKRPINLKILTKAEATKLIVGIEKFVGVVK